MILTFVWPWPNLWPWPQASQTKLNWCLGSKISIFHEMILTLNNDLDTQTWPRYGQDVTSYQKLSCYVNCFKSYSPNRQTDTHTHIMKTLHLPHTWEVMITKYKSLLKSTLPTTKSKNITLLKIQISHFHANIFNIQNKFLHSFPKFFFWSLLYYAQHNLAKHSAVHSLPNMALCM